MSIKHSVHHLTHTIFIFYYPFSKNTVKKVTFLKNRHNLRSILITLCMHRTHTCGQLTAHNIGQAITLSGWVANRRDHGGIIFIDIRDKYGLTQLVFDPQTHPEVAAIIEPARAEWVVKIEGEVRARPSGQENSDLTTGAIEVLV